MNKESLANFITVVIPTYNKSQRLARTLKYLLDLKQDFRILIADSSVEPVSPEVKGLLKNSRLQYYKYIPEEYVFRKILNTLEKVETPYVVIWADDDLLAPFFFDKYVAFLEANKDYSVVHGESFGFQLRDKKPSIAWIYPYPQRSYTTNNISERLLDYFDNYTTTFYSIQRTGNLRHNMAYCVDGSFDYFFTELLLSCLTIIQGKVRKIRNFYMLRECFNTQLKNYKNIDISERLSSDNFRPQYEKLILILSSELSHYAGIDILEAKKIIELAFWDYASRNLVRIYAKKKCAILESGKLKRSCDTTTSFYRYIPKLIFLFYKLSKAVIFSSFIKYRRKYFLLYRALTLNNEKKNI